MSAVPSSFAELNRHVNHNLTPPDDAIPTGETFTDSAGNRFPIYKEVREVTEKREVKDSAGNVLYHLNKDNTRQKPMTERVVVGTIEKEYVIVPVGDGTSQKNYLFRPSAEEIEMRQRQQDEAAAQTELSRFLAEQGKGFGDLLAGLKGAMKPAKKAD